MKDEYCRLCGENNEKLLKLSDEKFTPILKLRIHVNLHILISANDKLSHSICDACFTKLRELDTFVKCCQETQWKLLDMSISPILESQNQRTKTEPELSLIENEDVTFDDYVCDLILYDNESTENESELKNDNVDRLDHSTSSKKLPYSKLVTFLSSQIKMNSNKSISAQEDIPAKRFCQDIHNIEINDEKLIEINEESENTSISDLTDDNWEIEERSQPYQDLFATSEKRKKTKQSNLKTCPLCSHLFPPSEMEDHIRFHSDDEEYLQLIITEMYEIPFKHKTHYCEECKKLFVRDSLYMEHMKEHEKIRMINCHLCDHKFAVRKKLKVHLRAVHIPKSIKCDLCSYASKNIADMQKHKRGVHEGRPIICEICGKSVSSNISNYNRHLQTHSEERPYKCDLCNTAYKTASSLQKHRENIHFPKSVMCTACGTICGSRIKFKKHVRRCRKRMMRFS